MGSTTSINQQYGMGVSTNYGYPNLFPIFQRENEMFNHKILEYHAFGQTQPGCWLLVGEGEKKHFFWVTWQFVRGS